MAVERALVVGGGIAGLALAAGLARDGVDCEVVELAERWAPVGAGIVLSVNAMRVVRELGLEAAMRERGFALGRGAITDASGRDLLTSDFGSLEPGFGPTVALHRADLHEVLLAGARGVPIALGTTLAALHQDPGGVDVRLSDGRERRYDLVVGADGVRSRVRTLAFGAVSLRYSGATSWRLVVQAPACGAELCEMWGRGQRFGVVPIGAGRIYAYATANAARGAPDPAAGRAERFRERFAAFGGLVPEILARVERADQLIHADLEDLVFEPWWRGRVVLIGDAAHAMTPNMGQGAAMALEDVAVLREELRRGSAPEALPRFAGRRRGRVRWVQRQSWRLGRVGQWRGSLACRLRDAVLRAIPDRANEAALRRLASQPL